ncbi:MAG TPA: hypothetical protein PK858_10170, partial [Saprospiraceae bacterium]|nr:hypothetical protein [Saprospiraceae bacterium]
SISTSTEKNPPPVTFTEPGDVEIVLEASTIDGCTDTIRKVVQVKAGISKFAKVMDVSTANVLPYGAAQRADGNYQVLFGQGNSLRSVLVNTLGALQGAATTLSADNMTVRSCIPYNGGGFAVAGADGFRAKIKIVGSQQTLLADPASFHFDFSTASLVFGQTINADNNIAATGFRLSSNKYSVGFARSTPSGIITQGPLIPLNDGFGGNSIAQRPNGGYVVLASCQTSGCSEPCRVLALSTDGGYQSRKDLTAIRIPVRIVRAAGDSYVAVGYTAAGLPKALGLDASLSVVWERSFSGVEEIRDVAISTDGQLVVCGVKGAALYFAKYPLNAAGAATWEKPFSAAGASLQGIAITATADGGYLVLGLQDKSGEQDLYLAKTDADGNTQ